MSTECISSVHCFGGEQKRFKHRSESLNCDMIFAVYLPPQANDQQVPVVYYLSGLTCTDENFVTKAGAQRYAAEYGVAVVAPDTSPRGEGVADDPDGSYDMGLGAGFYLNATEAPWAAHYRMYDYVVAELPQVVAETCPQIDTSRAAITGHSMGGHGALTIGLKNPERYASFSAFSPIVAPTQCPWGKKAFSLYLGDDESAWRGYDSCLLLQEATHRRPILIDQGEADDFLEEQLKTPLILEAAAAAQYPIEVRMQSGYDHSYYFIASFIGDHLDFHARHLSGG
jgi:S-formylglutathione hydrolase